LLVLLTTSNFPDVMMPAYKESRLYAIFFIVYLIFGLYLLMNMLLAMFYANYKKRSEDTLLKFVDERRTFLETKFEELDRDKKGYLNKEETYQMFK
jgi:two pore calcium channel protein